MCVLCFLFGCVSAIIKTLCQACLCINLGYSFIIISLRQITGMVQGLKDLNMSKVFGAYDKVPLKREKDGFVRSSCQMWRNIHGHTFWRLKFVEDIY